MDGIPPAYRPRLCGTQEISRNLSDPLPPLFSLQFTDDDIKGEKIMKAMSKQQLADCAGVSVRTLMAWCRPYAKKLEEMGLRPRAKVLEPHIVKFLIHKLCIDVPP